MIEINISYQSKELKKIPHKATAAVAGRIKNEVSRF